MRKIGVITSSRADFGIYNSLLKELSIDAKYELLLFVTGSHLENSQGCTISDVRDSGYNIAEEVKLPLEDDSLGGIGNTIGCATKEFSTIFSKYKLDIVFTLGDRFEMFGAAVAAIPHNIPIAHIHGGEITNGAIDEYFRHSLTKLSTLHFVTTDIYRKRVIQMGEDPKSVFNVGSLSLDSLSSFVPVSKEVLQSFLNFKFLAKNMLVTFHPVTTQLDKQLTQLDELLKALEEYSEWGIVFTGCNVDSGGKIINDKIAEWCSAKPNRKFTQSLGHLRYFSMLSNVDVVVGNSSSGLLEAPSFKVATVNIGDRQSGRVSASSVINCTPSSDEILKAIELSQTSSFRETVKNTVNPYKKANSAKEIMTVLNALDWNSLAKNPFYDISFSL